MDNETLKGLAEGIGQHVRDEVSRVEVRLDEITDKLAEIPAPLHGKDGQDGQDGAPGESIVGPQGEPGPPGESIVGENGAKGDKGDPGESITGPAGEKGEPGPPGESIVGPQGEQGPAGESVVGEKGEKGDTGDTGPVGLGVETPLWEEGVYREGAVVQHNFGQHFRALQDTAENPNTAEWERVGSLGFRLAGSYKKDAEYAEGDLFVKDFGLFLYTKGEANCIAGRGPQGKRGEAGVAGQDGSDGSDGAAGLDGSEIKSLDFNGTDLVMVTERAGEFKNLQVSLEPFLQTAALVTKEAHAQQSKAVIEEAEQTVRKVFDHLNAHLDDQKAIPIRFYRGLWHSDTPYQVGDWVRYGSEDYLCHQANNNVAPVHGLVGQHNPAEYWFRVGGSSNQGGSAAGDGGSTGGPVFTNDVITRQDIPLRESNGRFRSIPKGETRDFETQLQVNRFFLAETEALNEAIDAVGEKGYDDTELRALIDQLPVTVTPDAPAINKDGELWYDDQRLELFVSYENGWFPCSPLGARIEEGEVVQAQILQRLETGESRQETIAAEIVHALGEQTAIEGRVKVGEGVQQEIKSDLVTLENKVKQIEGAVGEHTLNFTQSNQTPRHGEFNLLNDAMQMVYKIEEAAHIQISNVDADGSPVAIDRVGVGDVIRLAHGITGMAELRVTSASDGFFSVTKINGDLNEMFVGPYGFVMLSQYDPAGIATIAYVDQQDEILRQDTLTLNAYFERVTLKNEGTNQLPDETDWKIKQEINGSSKTLLQVQNGQLGAYNLKTPTSGHHATPKSYVDDEIARKFAELQDRLDAPPGQPFTYQSGSSGMSEKCFQYYNSDSRNKIRISTKSLNVDWASQNISGDRFWEGNEGPLFYTIWYYPALGANETRRKWKQRAHGSIDRIDWHVADCVCYIKSHHTKESFTADATYYITIGGVL